MTENEYSNTPDIKKIGLVIYLCLMVPVYGWAGYIYAFSIALGGALALINLALLERWLARLITPEADPKLAQGLVLFSFVLRLSCTGGVILYFHSMKMISFPALTVGLSIPLAAITVYFLMIRPVKDWYERAY